MQNKMLAEAMLRNSQAILGQQCERLETFVRILGTICSKKQCDSLTRKMLAVVIANLSTDQNLGTTFQQLCQGKFNEEQTSKVTEVYNMCNEEVRNEVKQHILTLN